LEEVVSVQKRFLIVASLGQRSNQVKRTVKGLPD